jgi:hypothetical protein
MLRNPETAISSATGSYFSNANVQDIDLRYAKTRSGPSCYQSVHTEKSMPRELEGLQTCVGSVYAA